MKKKDIITYIKKIIKQLEIKEQVIENINEENKLNQKNLEKLQNILISSNNNITRLENKIIGLEKENNELKKLILFNTEKISNLIKDTNDTNKRLLSKSNTIVNDYYQNLMEIASGNFEEIKQNEK